MENDIAYMVIVADQASHMLAAHIRFLAERSTTAAHKTRNELMTAMASLKNMPERYPFLTADFIPPNKYHKMLVKEHYLILYQVKDKFVYVDYIVDCRQDYTWLIR